MTSRGVSALLVRGGEVLGGMWSLGAHWDKALQEYLAWGRIVRYPQQNCKGEPDSPALCLLPRGLNSTCQGAVRGSEVLALLDWFGRAWCCSCTRSLKARFPGDAMPACHSLLLQIGHPDRCWERKLFLAVETSRSQIIPL